MPHKCFKKVWVARDHDGELFAYQFRPFYVDGWGGIWMAPTGAIYKVKNLLFDHLKYDDEPIETKILSDNLETLVNSFGKFD